MTKLIIQILIYHHQQDPSIDYTTITSVNATGINSYVYSQDSSRIGGYGVQHAQVMRYNHNGVQIFNRASVGQRRLNSNVNGNGNHAMTGRAPSVNSS